MTELEGLIAFWESMLTYNRWMLEVSMQVHIANTIKNLKELKKLKGE